MKILVPIATKHIRHSASPKQVNINSHNKGLFTSVSIMLYSMPTFKKKNNNKVQVCEKARKTQSKEHQNEIKYKTDVRIIRHQI